MKNGYVWGERKVRESKPKPKTDILSNFFNSEIKGIEKEKDKAFIENCLKIIKTDNFLNSNEQEKTNL